MEVCNTPLNKNENEPTNKNIILYDIIILQFTNLIKDLRVVFPSDIVLKVCQNNISCLKDNKIEFIDYLRKSITLEIRNYILNKDEKLFDKNNKSLKNINFKRSSFVFSRIRKNWEVLNSGHKDVVWKYMNFILKVLDRV